MKYSILIILAFLVLSCHKEDTESHSPSIALKKDSGYVFKDTIAKIGDKLKFGIEAKGFGNNLTNCIIKLNSMAYIDTGFNSPVLKFDVLVTKGGNNIDNWEFIIRDIKGNSSTLKLKIYKDSNSVFGNITLYSSVVLGAQNNNTIGSFASLSNGNIYSQQQAFENQQLIDLLYYYDNYEADKNTIASPGANFSVPVFTGSTGLANWTSLNTTRFIKLPLTIEQFDAIKNDSLLLASYSEINGKRKAKNLAAGDIYSFKTQSSKYGIFKVNFVNGTDAGTVSVEIKIQK